MKAKFQRYIIGLLLLCVTSCIENDIPYPYIELYITDVEGDGFTLRRITNSEQTVYLTLDETTDIEKVNITNVEYTDGAQFSRELIGEFDLTNPIKTSLYLYQEYVWQIVGEQSIEYNFTVEGQIGAERIDKDLLTINVDVNENTTTLDDITITSMKLGGEGVTTYSPTLDELNERDFSNGLVRVTATSHERSKTWSIYINAITPTTDLTADAWGTVAWLSATGDTSDEDECYFTYRRANESTWIRVDGEVTSNGVFEACVTGLTPETSYQFISYAAGAESTMLERTTESTPQLPNSGFEEWSVSGNNNTIFPYLTEEYWGTGNVGSTSVALTATNITEGDEDELAPNTAGEYSARLTSKSVFGVLATGNIFTGSFAKTSAPYGTIIMGRPFTQRPLRLEGYSKYNCGVVNVVKNDWGKYMLNIGDDDQGMIYVALGTWRKEEYGYDGSGDLRGTDDSPVAADTSAESTFFDSDAVDIIAYAEKIYTSTEDWSKFSIELEYRDLVDSNGSILTPAHSRVPTHIIVVAVSSRYGDYYTGSSSSVLWLDDLELIYE